MINWKSVGKHFNFSNMGTTALIVKEKDGKYISTAINYDGYVEHVGLYLYLYYYTDKLVDELISNSGYYSGVPIPTLGDNNKILYDYESETMINSEKISNKEITKEELENQTKKWGYTYLFDKGKWSYIERPQNGFKDLEKELLNLKII